jgi:hypothetical protein
LARTPAAYARFFAMRDVIAHRAQPASFMPLVSFVTTTTFHPALASLRMPGFQRNLWQHLKRNGRKNTKPRFSSTKKIAPLGQVCAVLFKCSPHNSQAMLLLTLAIQGPERHSSVQIFLSAIARRSFACS